MHLRLVVPDRCRDDVIGVLVEHPGVTNVVRLPGAALAPAGDLVLADVTREAGTDVLRELDQFGIREDGSIAIDNADTVLSKAAIQAERDAPGAPGDAVVWQTVVAQVEQDVSPSWSFHVFLIMATIIAGIAVVLDSPILVIGAMVVSPDFSPVAAACVGIVRRRWGLVWRALRLLVWGFALAIAVTTVLAVVARWAGWITAADIEAPRPLTAFIWTPDRWSFVVALLAGSIGVLSLTSARSSAMVGVFISVTTVPAAGALAVALATGVRDEALGSAAQLVVNVSGMLLSGSLTLLILRYLWHRATPADGVVRVSQFHDHVR